MNILLLHHFETMWEESLKKYDTDFDNQLNKYMDYIITNKDNIDKVIITRFEGFELEPEHSPLITICKNLNITIEHQEYAYGWTKDMNEDLFIDKNENIKWCYGTREHHDENDVLIIDDWMNELKDHTVYLGGAFENECIDDMNSALNAINVNIIKCDDLIVGTYVDYEFKSGLNDIDLLINYVFDIDDKYEELDEEFDLDNLSKVNFKIIEKDLLELELEINSKIYKNLELINLFELENDIYSSINNEKLREKIEKIIDFKSEFSEFSKIKEKFTPENKKSTEKLRKNLKP